MLVTEEAGKMVNEFPVYTKTKVGKLVWQVYCYLPKRTMLLQYSENHKSLMVYWISSTQFQGQRDGLGVYYWHYEWSPVHLQN